MPQRGISAFSPGQRPGRFETNIDSIKALKGPFNPVARSAFDIRFSKDSLARPFRAWMFGAGYFPRALPWAEAEQPPWGTCRETALPQSSQANHKRDAHTSSNQFNKGLDRSRSTALAGDRLCADWLADAERDLTDDCGVPAGAIPTDAEAEDEPGVLLLAGPVSWPDAITAGLTTGELP